MKNTNKKWGELASLRRRLAYDQAHGASAAVLSQIQSKIHELKLDIRREALGVEDEVLDVQSANRHALVRLMLEHDIVIPAREFGDWRPTKRNIGQVAGIWDSVVILMTNGILAYYLNGEEVVVGHIQKFDGKVEPLYSAEKPTAPKAPRKPREAKARVAMTTAAALELLAQMTKQTKA